MREEYERQIAELKAQFGDEHSSKTQLAEELRKLQESYDRGLAAAKVCKAVIVVVCLTHSHTLTVTHTLTHSLTHSLPHSLTHSLTHSHTHSLLLLFLTQRSNIILKLLEL